MSCILKFNSANVYIEGEEIRFGFNSINSIKTLSLPVLFQYRIRNKKSNVYTYFEGGVEVAYVLNAKMDLLKNRSLGLYVIDRKYHRNQSGNIIWLAQKQNESIVAHFKDSLRDIHF